MWCHPLGLVHVWLTWVCLEFGHPEVKSIIALNVSIRFEVYTNSLTYLITFLKYAPLLQPYPKILPSGGVLTFFDVGENGAFSTKNRLDQEKEGLEGPFWALFWRMFVLFWCLPKAKAM